MAFIFCFFANVLIIVFVPFLPEGYAIADLLMQFVIQVTVHIYFKHWEINVHLFIKNRFTLMLKAKSPANRLTFMARVMTRAKQIMKNCQDEPYADKFVKDCQKMCDKIYEDNKELTE